MHSKPLIFLCFVIIILLSGCLTVKKSETVVIEEKTVQEQTQQQVTETNDPAVKELDKSFDELGQLEGD